MQVARTFKLNPGYNVFFVVKIKVIYFFQNEQERNLIIKDETLKIYKIETK